MDDDEKSKFSKNSKLFVTNAQKRRLGFVQHAELFGGCVEKHREFLCKVLPKY